MSNLEDLPSDVVHHDEPKDIYYIDYLDDPQEDEWTIYPIYKESQTGGILVWQIGFANGKLLIKHGFERTSKGTIGQLQHEETEVEVNSSGRNITEQALLQARRRYQDKLKDGYHPGTESNQSKIPAQLAVIYSDTVLKENNFKRGVACQIKINGIRARIWNENGEVKIYSRKGNEFSWLNHIRINIKELLILLPNECGLDCELYNEGMRFQEITSIVKSRNIKHERNQEINCYIFDLIITNKILEERIEILKKCWGMIPNTTKHIFVIPTHIEYMRENLEALLDASLYSGYEGLILRKCIGIAKGYNIKDMTDREVSETYYKGNRNNNLIKYKRFKDDEGIVVGIKEGLGRDKGTAIFTIKTKTGVIFDCRPQGTLEERKYSFDHPELCTGKIYTYKYFELTKKGVPWHSTGIGFRDYE